MNTQKKIQAHITIKETFKNSEGWNEYPKKDTHRIDPLFSIPKKKEYKIKIIEIKNIKRKIRFIPICESKDVKEIKKKVIGAKTKCFLTKWYSSKLYLIAIDGVAAKEITQPININNIENIKIFLSILLHQL